MPSVDDRDLLIDLHVGNDRQGPGGDDETRRALGFAGLDPGAPIDALDLGSGVGASALLLARVLNARVTAVDAAPEFVRRLRERAEQEHVSDRVVAYVGRMESLGFEGARFDVVWSEGSIYTIGFETGVRAWRRFLRAGGVLAVTELTWTTDRRPAEVDAHWTREYPGITTPSANLRVLERAGYEPLAVFFLPRRCWEENYYRPLRAGFEAFLRRHNDSDGARRLVAAEEAEMRLYRDYGRWYGYAFYVARRTDDGR